MGGCSCFCRNEENFSSTSEPFLDENNNDESNKILSNSIDISKNSDDRYLKSTNNSRSSKDYENSYSTPSVLENFLGGGRSFSFSSNHNSSLKNRADSASYDPLTSNRNNRNTTNSKWRQTFSFIFGNKNSLKSSKDLYVDIMQDESSRKFSNEEQIKDDNNMIFNLKKEENILTRGPVSNNCTTAIDVINQNHKAKLANAIPIVEPRGRKQYDQSPIRSISSNNRISDLSINIPENNNNENDIPECYVSILKWGFRRKKFYSYDLTIENPSLTSSPATTPTRNAVVNSPKREINGNNDDNMKTCLVPIDAEIEFEVSIRLEGYSKSPKKEKQDNYWSVWRTANDILVLHTNMIKVLGDITPRRPIIKSLHRIPSEVTNIEISSDLKNISIFINALLRDQKYSKYTHLMDFLEFSKHYIIYEDNNQNDNNESFKFNEPAFFSFSDLLDNPKSPFNNNKIDLKIIKADEEKYDTTIKQEKWRKLFLQMRIKLKPRDIAVRSRLFEGVMSGDEILNWLLQSDSHNDSEACVIGQDLLDCGLLVTVCSGMKTDWSLQTINEEDNNNNEINSNNSNSNNKFSTKYGFIYKFPSKSSSVSMWSLFGSHTTITIPSFIMTDALDDSTTKSNRDSINPNNLMELKDSLDNNKLSVRESEISNYKQTTHVKYLINISHGGDNWTVYKRYKEFELLNKKLQKYIKLEMTLPSKLQYSRAPKQIELENRRLGLEEYLNATIINVINSRNSNALNVFALFVDDEFSLLLINI